MRFIKKGRRYVFQISSVVMLIMLLGTFSSATVFAEETMRVKKASSMNRSADLACNKARKSAKNRAELDCVTSGGIIDSQKFFACKCNHMGEKSMCSVTVTYECK